MPKPDAMTALQNLAIAFDHHNDSHPNNALKYRSPPSASPNFGSAAPLSAAPSETNNGKMKGRYPVRRRRSNVQEKALANGRNWPLIANRCAINEITPRTATHDPERPVVQSRPKGSLRSGPGIQTTV
ncbi:hypothetical protein Q8F57_000445 [Paraburkholderia terrae]|uniref:hypothetical protein n=1 Tax=Paraburkholderia terrae TaxID=311230 RepID=UPI0037C599EA